MNNNEEAKNSKSFVLLTIILIFFLITLSILVYFIKFKTDLTPNADTFNVSKTVSNANSYIFASPVRAKAGGDLIRLTSFILDSEGVGIYDKKVSVKTDLNLDIKEIQSLTDETGKAIFDIGSKIKGTYKIEVFVEGIPLDQNLLISFD